MTHHESNHASCGPSLTGEYNCPQAGISYQITEHVARCPVYTQRVSLALARTLTKVNFEHVASKTQCEHVAAFSHLHERC